MGVFWSCTYSDYRDCDYSRVYQKQTWILQRIAEQAFSKNQYLNLQFNQWVSGTHHFPSGEDDERRIPQRCAAGFSRVRKHNRHQFCPQQTV